MDNETRIDPSTEQPWLPVDWDHPTSVDLSTGHHLRPIHPDDTEQDMPAVTGVTGAALVDLRDGLGVAAGKHDR